MNQPSKPLVAIIGAGPSGLYAAQQLVRKNVDVVIFNRDIKIGGLAEYGIYPEKHKMRLGLITQFQDILNMDGITYYGNMLIRENGDLTFKELLSLGFDAVVVATGAQWNRWLFLPGEKLDGVYYAQDVVYHYNGLPPYSSMDFPIGEKVVIIGMGNVSLDLAHFLTHERKVQEITAVARRGPGEIKFTQQELEAVAAHLDFPVIKKEIEGTAHLMKSLDQDPEEALKMIKNAIAKSAPRASETRFTLRFLLSPVEILGNEEGKVTGIKFEKNTLIQKENYLAAEGLEEFETLDADTIMFSIGNRVDGNFGLPVKNYSYCKSPNPRFPIKSTSYEVCTETGEPIEKAFVVGWARKASVGLVGLARKDSVQGSKAVLQYLDTLPSFTKTTLQDIDRRIAQIEKPIVRKADLSRLIQIENEKAQELGLEEYKYKSNQEMLKAIGLIS